MSKNINSRVVFITTSPRSPLKMVPEIDLLNRYFKGLKWNSETQLAYIRILKDNECFNGDAEKNPTLSARDRINRSPKLLGFVDISSKISLTQAGELFISSPRKEEIILRQLLKFQLPSPYHKLSNKSTNFSVKPYLEIFRLIRHFGVLKFDELYIFGLQLVNYKIFDNIVSKIEQFRIEKIKNSGSYKRFKAKVIDEQIREIYKDDIEFGNIKIRASKETSIDKFIATKSRNMRDYADACFRYLRATGIVNISHVGRSISIVPEKAEEVDYFLANCNRAPSVFNDESSYISYIGDAKLPKLLTDDKDRVISLLNKKFPSTKIDLSTSVEKLNDLLHEKIEDRKQEMLDRQICDLKNYHLYDDIQSVFDQMNGNNMYDIPLMFEWNTWRAMTMLNGGNIKANLKFDDFGKPMSTAQGNMADIVCDYGEFGLCVEVTMSAGQRQYEMEGEPVARHLANYAKFINKPTYCLFIAPKINAATIAHFYTLYNTNIVYYRGESVIVPITLNVFRKMIEDSVKVDYIPTAKHVKLLFDKSREYVANSENEQIWFEKINNFALNWLDNY